MSTALTTVQNGTNSTQSSAAVQHKNSNGLMTCNLSGITPPEHPVVCTKTGLIYERHLLEKYVELHHTEPAQNIPCTINDILTLQNNNTVVKPRIPQNTSIPSLLQLLQSEYDNILLESYNLRQQLDSTRHELATALYQYDAAQRVISRLIQERDIANNALMDTKNNINSMIQSQTHKYNTNNTQSMDIDTIQPTNADNGANQQLKQTVEQTSTKLMKTRSADVKAIKAQTITAAQLKSFTQRSSISLHSTTPPGITCINRHTTNTNIVVTGGADGSIVTLDTKQEQIVEKLKPTHNKSVTSVHFVTPTDNTVFSTSSDNTAYLYSNDYKLKHTFKHHTDSIIGSAIHPSTQYAITASHDKTYQIHDLHSLHTVHIVPNELQYTAIALHSDGALLGQSTTDSIVNIIDLRTLQSGATLNHTTATQNTTINTIAFNTNGYIAATGDSNGVCKIWDLRKPTDNIHSIELNKSNSINQLVYDSSSLYLGVAANTSTAVYDTKTLDTVVEYQTKTKTTGIVLSLQNGTESYIGSTGMDRQLRLYGLPTAS